MPHRHTIFFRKTVPLKKNHTGGVEACSTFINNSVFFHRFLVFIRKCDRESDGLSLNIEPFLWEKCPYTTRSYNDVYV